VSRLLEILGEDRVLVADGGTGALITTAVSRLRCPEEANLRAPEAVVKVHQAFIRAGAELIETNTFGANRRKLAGQFLDDRLEEIVERGVKLAREAREVSGAPVLIGGAIGPLGELEGEHGAALDAYDVFREQARLLEGRGVDLFLVETFFDLDELAAAISAVQDVSSLPIVAQLTFDEDAQTLAGVSAREAVERLRGLGVVAVGANCGLGPQAALAALSEMSGHANGVALSAQPNVGLPSRSGGRLIYPHATPDYFGEFAAQATTLGARIVGGCCGTTAAQIAAIRAAVVEHRAPRGPLFVAEREVLAPTVTVAGKTRLEELFDAGEWVVSVELDPPKGTNMERMLEVSARLAGSGLVHEVDINDNPMARARLSALMAAVTIERVIGIETIPHVTPRDASIMGLQSQLLGAHSEGVRNVLAVTGDPPHVGDYPGASGVYELDAIGLTGLLARLNGGEDYSGKAIDAPTAFYVGVAVNPSADDLDTELERFRQKLDAGARFAMTQALFDVSYLDRFVERLGGEMPIPCLLGVWPLSSYQLAVRLHNEVPGITVPDAVQRQLADAGADARQVGFELARELLEEARSRVAGIYVIPPFKEPEAALELLTPSLRFP
jgi:methionine synthase I (cobalamin-dependent)/5,10-methylenetetrahydrofolate reductase